MKKTICLIAAICLLLTLFPMTAAAEAATQPHSGKGSIPVQVNPLYADILDVEDISRTLTRRPAYATDGEEEYVEESQFVSAIRENLKQRNEYFTVYLKTSSTHLSTVISNAFYDAFDHTGVPTEGDYLEWQYGWWSADYYYSFDSGFYYVEVPFYLSYYTTAAQETELDLAVEDLLDELDLYGKSDYEKICGVYDYITENIYYDYENLEDPDYMLMYTAYAALVNKTAVCQGYANLLYRLLLELDVDTRIVVGWAGGPHAWNIVELEDWYYYADSTWDAQNSWGYDYFLLGSNNFSLDHTDDQNECPFLPYYSISATDYVPGQPGQEPEPESWPKTGYCGDDMTWTLTGEGVLTISGTGSMWDFEYQDPEWYPYANQIQECVIEEGVTDLGDYAFYKCYSLSSIDLPNSLQYTGEGAFTYCESLTDVTIPDGVTSIGRQTFAGCTNLTSVTIPASVTFIGEIAFLYCDMLWDVYYGGSQSQWAQIDIQDDNACLLGATIHCSVEDPEPGPDPDPEPDPDTVYTGYCGDDMTWTLTEDGLLTISGTGPMWDYSQDEPGWYTHVNLVQECVIEEGVTSIGNWAFWDCWALEQITVGADLSLIGEGAFSYCYALRELNLPVSITAIEEGAFYDCFELSDVYYAGSAAQWSQIVIDDLNEELLSATIHYGSTDPAPEPDPEPEPDSWPKSGFCGDNVTWSLTEDGVLTLSGTGSTWNYPEDYPGWHEYVELVKECIINEGITVIGDYLLYDCWAITNIQIPDSVHSIGEGAFAYCMNLTTVNIPVGVTAIEMGVFCDCFNLADVYFGGSEAQWKQIIIEDYNNGLDYATIHYGQTDPAPEPEPHPEPTCGTTNEEIYEILISLKDEYPEGMHWDNSDSYKWNINYTYGYGCAAFSFILSDAAFGYLPSRTIYDDITIEDLRVGDIIRMYNDSHSAVVLEVHDTYVVLAEGNYNSSIHWGRIYTAEEIARDTTYVTTRYPEHHFEDGVCTECGAKEPEPEHAPGDINGDGKVNNKDASLLFQYVSGWNVDVDPNRLDVNGDGKVNNKDASRLFQYVSGWDIEIY